MFLTPDAIDGIMADANATGKTLAGNLVKLFKARTDPVVDPSTFTEADFSGYSDVPVAAWTGPRHFPNDNRGLDTIASFNGATATPQVDNVIRGYYVTDSTGATLIGWEDFPEAVPMGGPTAFLNVTVPIEVDPNAKYGDSVQS